MPDFRARARFAVFPVLILVLAACGSSAPSTDVPPDQAPASVAVPAIAETPATAGSQPNDAAIWLHPTDPSKSVLLGASGEGGLEVFGLDGKRIGHVDAQLDFIDTVAGFSLSGSEHGIVVGHDRKAGALVTFIVNPATLNVSPVSARPLAVGSEVTGLCAYRSPRTGRHYVFAATDEGYLQQWELFEKAGKVEGGLVRTLPVGVGAGYCAVDEQHAALYVTEETIGIWKLAAEPEADAERELVDTIGPRGRLTEEVKGIAIYAVDAERGYLLAADVAAGRINVYSTADSQYIGSFSVQAPETAKALQEAEGLAVTSLPLGRALPGGMVAIADQSAGAPAAHFRLLSWAAIAAGLKLDSATGANPPAARAAASARNVMPSVETEPVDDYGDAADDPAIWLHPKDPSKSLIIGAQKKRGLYVYDLSGKTLQVVADGRMNNVDLRHGFRLGSESVALVAASNRTTRTLSLYKVDPIARRLVEVAATPVPTGFRDPYGLCMYRSAATSDYYVFMNDADSGAYKQWRLAAKGAKVSAELVREFTVGTQAEGCAADDETGALYVAEEDIGLWRYEAEPAGADRRVALDSTEAGNLEADVEGVAIYSGANGTGYVIVSNQGDDNYAVYKREGKNEFLGHFSVIADTTLGIDGASETDGLDVISTPLGPAFPHGVFIVQDGRNISPSERQNFKLVPWERVAETMRLQTLTGGNPSAGR